MKIKEKGTKKVKLMKKIKKKSVKSKNLSEVTTDEFLDDDFEVDDSENEPVDSDSGESELDPKEHKKSLKKLENTDPEFYKFLKQNDKKLLEFELSDDDVDQGSDDEEGVHVPDDDLAVR